MCSITPFCRGRRPRRSAFSMLKHIGKPGIFRTFQRPVPTNKGMILCESKRLSNTSNILILCNYRVNRIKHMCNSTREVDKVLVKSM